jgi:glutathione S-transferase
MLLYVFKNSGNCAKVTYLLDLLQSPYELVVLDRENIPPEFSFLSPLNKVPVLEDKGQVYLESMAILYYLAQGTSYMPVDLVRMLKWFSFEQGEIQQSIAIARYRLKHGEGDIADLQVRGHRALAVLEDHLQKNAYLVHTFSICDIAMAAYVRLAGEAQMDLAPYPAVIKWLT